MGFIIDIILLAVAVLIIVMAVKKGFVKSILSLATSIVALVVACAFTPYLSQTVTEGFLLEKVSSGIESTVGSVTRVGDGYDFSGLFENTPDVMVQVLDRYGVSEESLENFVTGMTETGAEGVEKISMFIATPVVTQVANAAAFVIIFLAAFIILKIVSKLIELLFKAPVLKTADKAAGIILGVINAFLVLWVLSLAISLGVTALGSVSPGWFGESVIENSIILKIFAEYNPIKIISKIIAFEA